MAFNGYRNFETWKFMLYFEEYLYGILREQNITDYKNIYNAVKIFVEEMYDSVDKNNTGSSFLNDVIGDFLTNIDIKEVAEHLEQDLKEN